jgi:hypothetical protein
MPLRPLPRRSQKWTHSRTHPIRRVRDQIRRLAPLVRMPDVRTSLPHALRRLALSLSPLLGPQIRFAIRAVVWISRAQGAPNTPATALLCVRTLAGRAFAIAGLASGLRVIGTLTTCQQMNDAGAVGLEIGKIAAAVLFEHAGAYSKQTRTITGSWCDRPPLTRCSPSRSACRASTSSK